MATSPLFGWEEPDDTDLVKDGAAAIRTLGNAIDTSMGDLLGGTTGQILSKNSNTNMDFTWVAPTTGDITGVTAGTGITGGGTSGTVTVSLDQANFGGGQFAAGKNKIINGDFNIWQRGTSIATNAYNSDRWTSSSDASVTISRQTFTPGAAPVAGYEGVYFCRIGKSAGGSFTTQRQHIENVQTFAGQTVVLSFWAKASTAVTLEPYYEQVFGSGGSGTVGGVIGSSQAITTSWARYSFTTTLPSISGKTIGTSSHLIIYAARYIGAAAVDIDIWGVQLEAGSTATPFQTASGSLGGELALCQRYFQKSYDQGVTPGTASADSGSVVAYFASSVGNGSPFAWTKLHQTMRTVPTLTIYSYGGLTTRVSDNNNTDLAANSATVTRTGEGGFALYNNSGGTIAPGNNGFRFQWTGSAEL